MARFVPRLAAPVYARLSTPAIPFTPLLLRPRNIHVRSSPYFSSRAPNRLQAPDLTASNAACGDCIWKCKCIHCARQKCQNLLGIHAGSIHGYMRVTEL